MGLVSYHLSYSKLLGLFLCRSTRSIRFQVTVCLTESHIRFSDEDKASLNPCVLAFLLGAFSFIRTNSRTCGTTLTDAEIFAAENHFQANKISPSDLLASTSKAIVNVIFHVVSENKTVSGGDVSDSDIAAQINVLNKAYSHSGITFVLKQTTRTVNQTWFNLVGPGNAQQMEMKTALRQGGAADLNVYTVGYSGKPIDDGVVVNSRTLPGGRETNYNLGQTLTHEVGHWVGLFHTFQNGCDGKGDYVDDTPSEAEPAFGCPEGRDTCPSDGKDPIHNYMDYTYDTCMTEFTNGQVKRIGEQMATYRNHRVSKL
ncbi:Ulilysin [Termitomyces sp. T112]|nr:Ulilysin [Termitomyces sp. T112]